jgi:voltage-gated hydrogen channel 1
MLIRYVVQFPESRSDLGDTRETWISRFDQARDATRHALASRAKHWIVFTPIVFVVLGILSDIFIALITCELGVEDEDWVFITRDALGHFALATSCLFMVELAISVFAEGYR